MRQTTSRAGWMMLVAGAVLCAAAIAWAGKKPPPAPVQPNRAPPPIPGEMVSIPSGKFMMGTDSGSSDEKPVHEVSVTAFALDKTEVTVAAYKACVQAGKCTAAMTGEDCNWNKGGKEWHPINCVNWDQATAYCGAVGKRLPTEEEWEYAARGTNGRTYPWGNEAPDTQACWSGKTHLSGTCEVGKFPSGASPFGVLDLAGNVWEWTSSGYSQDYSKDRTNYNRVVRGCGWGSNNPSYLRSAERHEHYPSYWFDDLGFRCAR